MPLIKSAGHTHTTACTGAVTLILEGVRVDHPNGTARFRWVKAPTST